MQLEVNNSPVDEEAAAAAESVEYEANEGGAEEISSDAKEETLSAEDSEDAGQGREEQTDWQDRYLRLYAEFDNYRKRTMRERVELIRNASRDVVEKLIPILDDYSRAENAVQDVTDVIILKEGQALIHNKFKQLLEGQGLKAMAVEPGDRFDVDFHEAITRIPAPKMSGKVVEVVEVGYLMNDVVIRYAKVVVGE